MSGTEELLRVENLSVRFGSAQVIDDLSFSVRAGRTTAVVGESGSGKSVTSLSIMRLADMAGADYPQGKVCAFAARRSPCSSVTPAKPDLKSATVFPC